MKPTKSLWRVSVITTPEAEDAVSELLGAVPGQPVSSYFNLETGVSTVAAYCRRKPASPAEWRAKIRVGLDQIKNCGLKIGSGKVTIAKMRREDWAESWKRHFKPIEIRFQSRGDELRESLTLRGKLGRRGTPPSEGRSLLIKPSWSKRRARKNQAVVVLDPGLSFGTGQHPTTAFCLRELVRCGKIETRRSFLDIGTGSGILAIAAAKLGYSPVHAFDFDPEAVRVARANARANGVHKKLRIARRRRDKTADSSGATIRFGLRKFDFDAAACGAAADGGAIETRRNARAGGHFEIGIFTGANDFWGTWIETCCRKNRKRVVFGFVLFRRGKFVGEFE